MGRWSSTLLVPPITRLGQLAKFIHFSIKMAMKILTNKSFKMMKTTKISQFVAYFHNRSHLCDKRPPCKRDRGHLCNCTSLQFSGDRAFVCVERDLFCAILRLHPPHLSGGHISEQDTQSHHCCLAKPLNVFHRGARTTCRSLLLTVPQLFSFAFSLLCNASVSMYTCTWCIPIEPEPAFLVCSRNSFTPHYSLSQKDSFITVNK